MPENAGRFEGHTGNDRIRVLCDNDFSEYVDNYQKYAAGGPSKSFKPVLKVVSGGEFHGATDYRDKFVPHKVERIQVSIWIISVL